MSSLINLSAKHDHDATNGDSGGFLSLLREHGFRLSTVKDRENAEDVGNDVDFLPDADSAQFAELMSIFGQQSAPLGQPKPAPTRFFASTSRPPATSTARLPMKDHLHRDESPTELIIINDVAEPVFESELNKISVEGRNVFITTEAPKSTTQKKDDDHHEKKFLTDLYYDETKKKRSKIRPKKWYSDLIFIFIVYDRLSME